MLWAMAVSEWSRAIAVAAFVASYVGLALGRVPGFRIDCTGVAIIGAALMVASGAVPWADAARAARDSGRGLRCSLRVLRQRRGVPRPGAGRARGNAAARASAGAVP